MTGRGRSNLGEEHGQNLTRNIYFSRMCVVFELSLAFALNEVCFQLSKSVSLCEMTISI